MTPALLSAVILVATLVLFVSDKVRHDLVALIALFACLLAGLVAPGEALAGFADPAVVTVAAVLVVGRAVELSGIAGVFVRRAIPIGWGFAPRLAAVLVVGAALSGFMNNIAALVITMPIASEVARQAGRSPGATLMPLAFATILGGMITLIGTPANLILSSVREQELGAGFSFFQMAPVALAVTGAGLLYLTTIGWRLTKARRGSAAVEARPWRVFELDVPADADAITFGAVAALLRKAEARTLALFRDDERVPLSAGKPVERGDRLLLLSRKDATAVAEAAELAPVVAPASEDEVTARVVVANGSFLIGWNYQTINARSDGRLCVVAAGPRAARLRQPLHRLSIQPGDQLYVRGQPEALAEFVTRARLLEIDRFDPPPAVTSRALLVLGIFAAAILTTVLAGVSPAITFLAAAAAIAGLRLMPSAEVYRSVDWSVVLLLAAMIPVGRSFETSGAADATAAFLAANLAGLALPVILGTICTATMLLSIFLNNVATALVMGPLAIQLARLLEINPDAALLAVLIGASSDFLTPIGHHNNALVMGPGGYRFTDYARVGAVLAVIVVVTTATFLSSRWG